MTWACAIKAVLLWSLLLVVVGGVASTSTSSPTVSSVYQSASSSSSSRSPPPQYGKAFYILFEDMINNSSWPSGYEDYSLFVASPQNLTTEHIEKIHSTVPGSIVLAYWFVVCVERRLSPSVEQLSLVF